MMDKKVTPIYVRPEDYCDITSHSTNLEEETDIHHNSYGETCEWNLPATAEARSSRGLAFVKPFISVTTSNADIATETVITNKSACSNSSTVTVVNKDPFELEMLSYVRSTNDTVNKLASTISELTYALKMQCIPMQSTVMRTGKDFTEGCKFNYKDMQNVVDDTAERQKKNFMSEKAMALATIADIVNSQYKQGGITVSSSSDLESPTVGSKNLVMKNLQQNLSESVRQQEGHCSDQLMMEAEAISPTEDCLQSSSKDSSLALSSVQSEATLESSIVVTSVIWPHTLVNEDLAEFVTADNIFISSFLIGFCKILTLKPEETKGRLSLLHATALVYEGLFSWSEARAFHNAILINIEQGLINWATDFVSMSIDFLMKKLKEKIKQGNQGTETGKCKIVSSIDKLMDKKKGSPSKIKVEIKKPGHSSKAQAIKSQSDNDETIVDNEYSEDTSNNEEEISLDNCHPEINTCPLCLMGFSLKNDLTVHMKTHTGEQDSITSMPQNNFNYEKVRRGKSHISSEIKTEIAKDCIKLGVINANQKWSKILGHSIPKSRICDWKAKYLKQLQDIDGVSDMLLDKKQGQQGKTLTIESESDNDEINSENEYSEDTRSNEEENSLDNCHPEIFTCAICLTGFTLKDDLIIHMETHTGENYSNSEKIRKINISIGIRTKITKDCIKLGVTKAQQKWFQILGVSISKNTLYIWRTNYLKQSQDIGGNLIQIHTCPICLIGFSKKNEVTIHMETHTGEQDSITLVPQNESNSGKVKKSKLKISAGIRTKIAKDSIMLGHTKAKQKWSQLLSHSIPLSTIGNWKRDYLKWSREKDQIHLVPQNKTKIIKVRKRRPRVYNNTISNEIRTEIAKDCIKLGNAQARLKWSQKLGYSIPVSSIRICKINYLKQLQSQEDKLLDNKQCHTGQIQAIESKSQNNVIIAGTEDSGDTMTYIGEKNLAPEPHAISPCNANEPITYTLVPNGSQKGEDTLIDSLGFKYVRKSDKKLPNLVTWVCTVRRSYLLCNGRVLPRKGVYIRKGIHTCKAMLELRNVTMDSGNLNSLFDDKKGNNSSTHSKPIKKE